MPLYQVEFEEAATHYVVLEAQDEPEAEAMGRELIANLPLAEWPGVETVYSGIDVINAEYLADKAMNDAEYTE
jgi:hypothetical protein